MKRPRPKPQKIRTAASQCSVIAVVGVANLRHPASHASYHVQTSTARCPWDDAGDDRRDPRRYNRPHFPLHRSSALAHCPSGRRASPARRTAPSASASQQRADARLFRSDTCARILVGALVVRCCARSPPVAQAQADPLRLPRRRTRPPSRARRSASCCPAAARAASRTSACSRCWNSCASRSTTSPRRRWARSSAACTRAACRRRRWKSRSRR